MLFDKMLAILQTYPTAVLTAIDRDGYPFSVRCQPQADPSGEQFTITLPDNLPQQTGAVSLLFHAHDELLDNLRSVTVQGKLEQQGGQWLFQPERIIPGMGATNFFQIIKDTLLTPRRNAKRYLQKNNLPRPTIPWDQLRKIVDEIDGQ